MGSVFLEFSLREELRFVHSVLFTDPSGEVRHDARPFVAHT
jgi:hypothetical protein